MKRIVPAPWLSVGIFGGWLLLNQSLSVAQLLLAFVVALAMPLLFSALRPSPGPMRRWGVLLRLIALVGVDVVASALQVAFGVLRARRRPPQSAFVTVPLELRDPHALAALAVITAVVPGTVWSELAADHSVLLVHVFDVPDEAAFVAHFKQTYERPLKEIFE
ncbi:Na+/H+ antiporter subunit E [Aquabacterium sp. UBA2148]|uniref:Na+/H+ antiporter subunit E n=1 Tax=Aquabacterium sp. UBA2148 TaxID=1946042 RepID=UPI00257C87D2|nr:Na+/H+ antiporter subunit E [Aquabacterium sp. UBA2148]